MKKYAFTLSALSALALISCTKESAPLYELDNMTLSAQTAVSSRSSLDCGSMKVEWLPSDQISVFDVSGNHLFKTSGYGESADFWGQANKDSDKYVLYPYDAAAVCDMTTGTISASFPSEQYGIPGRFADGANLSVGIVKDNGFIARNLAGLISVTLQRGDITSVKLTAIGGESLAGKVDVSFDASDLPEVECTAGESSVTLLPAAVLSSFEPGTYYIPVLPCVLSSGLEIEICCQGGYVKKVEKTSSLTIGRSKYVELGVIDGDIPEDRVVILFGDSITHKNVWEWLDQQVKTMNTATVNYRAVLAGRSGETPSQITAREGGVPLYVKGPLVISAKASVKTTIGSLYTDISESGEKLQTPSRTLFVDLGKEKLSSTATWTGCSNPFRIGGVLCQISGTDGSLTLNAVYNTKQDIVINDAYIPVEPLAKWKYSNPWARTCYMGTNGEGNPKIPYNHEPGELHSYEDLGRFYDLAIAAKGADAHFLVLGFHNSRWNENTRNYLSGKYGNIFVDMRTVGYTNADTIASEIGSTLDDVDRQYIANKDWPRSWQDMSNPIHPSNPVGHHAYAQIAFDKMKAMGWFD